MFSKIKAAIETLKKPEKLIDQAKKDGVVFIQLWFSDIYGNLKRTTIPVKRLEAALKDGIWFDGSSIEGFTRIQESDARLLLDSTTYQVIPWTPKDKKTARLICDVFRPDGKVFEGDPRQILKRVLNKARDMGFIYNVGPEVEFYLLRENENGSGPFDLAGYFDATGDLAEGLRHDVMLRLDKFGIPVEMGHHECGSGQNEIDIEYSDALTMADRVITLKHVIERTARDLYQLLATFMPKPTDYSHGSGMHIHQSLFGFKGRNLFYDPEDPYRLSKLAYHFIAGQMRHIKALAALIAPTVNSYKRLVPGYEAPTYICWAQANRAALMRIPAYTAGKERSTRCELRCPDPSANPYLAFAAMLAAGLDGIEKEMRCPNPVEENVYHFSEEDLRKRSVENLPGSLKEALDYLEKDTIILEALGEHTAQKFLKAKKHEWEEYENSWKNDPRLIGLERTGQLTAKITAWEIKKYLGNSFKNFLISNPS